MRRIMCLTVCLLFGVAIQIFSQNNIPTRQDSNISGTNSSSTVSINKEAGKGQVSPQSYKAPAKADKHSTNTQTTMNFIFGICLLSLLIVLLISFWIINKQLKRLINKAIYSSSQFIELNEKANSTQSYVRSLSVKLEQMDGILRDLAQRNTGPQVPNIPTVVQNSYQPENINEVKTSNSLISELLYAQQPLPNGIFNKTEKEFKKLQTIFIIEPAEGPYASQGTFTLVKDEDTLAMALKTSGTFLPSFACEVKGHIRANLSNAKITNGTVKKIGDKWAVDRRLIIEFW